MGTIIGVVYGEKSKLVRRVVIPDHDEAMEKTAMLRAGESLITFEKDETKFRSPEAAKLEAWRLIGVDPASVPSGRCAVVDEKTQMVTAAVMADPELDSMDGARLIASDVANVGWKYDGQTFLARFVTIERASDEATEAKVIAEDWLDPATRTTSTMFRADAAVGDTISVTPFIRISPPSEGTTVL